MLVTHTRRDLGQPTSSFFFAFNNAYFTINGSVLTGVAPVAGGAVVKFDSSKERERTFSIKPLEFRHFPK